MILIDEVKFDQDGLIPAIVQNATTGQVLMLAYMNRESLAISIAEGRTCFWSRSRQKLWRKGESSGNIQRIESITADCDADSLLIKVSQAGPACHTGKVSCFHNNISGPELPERFSIESLYTLIEGRKSEKKDGSYTSYLFEKGEDKILKKVGEECSEVIIASKNNDNTELVYEIADLCYHALVLMVQKGITISDIGGELSGRHVVDKKVKQENMSQNG